MDQSPSERARIPVLALAGIVLAATALLVALGAPAKLIAAVAPLAPTHLPKISQATKDEAAAKLQSAHSFQEQGQLGLALEEARQALSIWPDYEDARAFVKQVGPQATATIVEASRQSAEATATARAQAIAVAAEATRVAKDPPITVLSQNVKRVDNRVHVLGEIRNDSPFTVFWRVDVHLEDAAGSTVASGRIEADGVYASTNSWRWAAPPLAAGEVQPYWVTVAGAPPFTKVAVTAKAEQYAATYPRLLALPPKLAVDASVLQGGMAVHGAATNPSADPVEAHVLVWFLNKDGLVVDAHDQRLLQPAPLYPGVSALFEERANAGDATAVKWVAWGTPPPR